MELLGERIKRLRKERKMTLADVAGDRLTKGMLSLIENGKAQPSMESLQHIAAQLHVDLAELVQSETTVDFTEMLLQVQSYYQEVMDAYGQSLTDVYTKIIEYIKPYVGNELLKGQTYEEVRIYENYLLAIYYRDQTLDVAEIKRLVTLYEEAKAYRKILNPFSILAMVSVGERNYEQALQYLLEGEAYLNKYMLHIDNLEKLDYYYNLTVVNAALNNDVQTAYYVEEAFKLSKKHKIYYRLTDFYRFLFFAHLQSGEFDKCWEYLRKSEAFMVIMEDKLEAGMVFILKMLATNIIEKDYEKTLSLTFDFGDIQEEAKKQANVFLNIEYGYAHYELGHFEKVAEYLAHIYVPPMNNHPLDLAFIYRGFALRALALYEMGKVEDAKRDILYAMDGVKDFHLTIFKQYILNAHEKIMN
jgi:transcriptional regulator with XRE-family HTH domain